MRYPLKYVLFVGEMLIDFIPHRSGEDGTFAYQPHPGGAVANAAVALAKLGGSARFLGKLGEDHFGRLLLRTLREHGVDLRVVPTTAWGNTTLVLVTLQDDGQREFTFYRQGTADTLLEVGDLVPSAWEDVAFCHAGSVLLASEPACSAVLSALAEARQRGLVTSFDVNARPALWSSLEELRALLARVASQVDLLKFSVEEAHYLDSARREALDPADTTGLLALAERLLDQGTELVVITRGPAGTLLINRQQSVEIATQSVQAIDTTGAGDAFMGAALYQLLVRGCITPTHLGTLNAEELRAIGTFANRAAGLSCTRYGGIASLPELAELEAF